MRAQQRRAERRRTLLIVGPALALVLTLITVVGVLIFQESQRQEKVRKETEAAAKQPIQAEQSFDNLAYDHVETPVTYPQSPPVGGNHSRVWQNCGIYTQPVRNENAVHSLEHGAVWITYQPTLPKDQLETLTELAKNNSYTLLSPYEGLKTPVVLSAWGKQLSVQTAGDERVAAFVRRYVQGPQTREPGAPCTGGTGEPS